MTPNQSVTAGYYCVESVQRDRPPRKRESKRLHRRFVPYMSKALSFAVAPLVGVLSAPIRRVSVAGEEL